MLNEPTIDLINFNLLPCLNLKSEYVVVYEINLDDFGIGYCVIKVTVGFLKFSPFAPNTNCRVLLITKIWKTIES